jgi:citronellol/citronellal dehydrogenase
MSLKNKVIIITGSSRGIGREMALRFAKDGAKLVLAAKSVEEGKLPGTIHSVAEEVQKAGGQALAVQVDVREEDSVKNMVEQAVSHFGGIDILVNNAGAIQLTKLEVTPPKRMDLMLDINVRGVLMCSHFCLPYLKKAGGAHILNLSPPVLLDPKWFANNTVYTISKYGMSLATIGLAEELKDDKIAVNSLWPRTLVATAAVNMLMGQAGMEMSRTPAIMADAAYEIVTSDPQQFTGKHIVDEYLLRERGVTDFKPYNNFSGEGEPALDFYIEELS